MSQPTRRTKIICTIGPASESLQQLIALGNAGMDVARLNFSHGTHEWHERVLKRVQQASRRLGKPIAVLQDLQGPKIRVGTLPSEGITLTAGRPIVFSTSPSPAPNDIPVTLPDLHRDVKRGARFLLDDGLLECVVRRVDGRRIHCEVVHGGKLTSNKGLNLPGTALRIPALSDKDRADAQWGVKHGVDFVALSFVRNPTDVHDLRRLLDRSASGRKIKIVGKIEKQEAVDRFEQILPLLDAVMVARGDLGIETDASTVPVVQKQLVARCRDAAIPVIVATQMLDSMQRNPRPTRAEVSDVANAVSDHADAVMLSGETANGTYPVQSVRMMADTVRAMENSVFDDVSNTLLDGGRGVPELLGAVVRLVSDALMRAPVVVLTASGRTAREASSFRPDAPIYAIAYDRTVERQCRLLWGVTPFYAPRATTPEKRLKQAVSMLTKQKALKRGMRAIVVSGPGKPGTANRIEIVTV